MLGTRNGPDGIVGANSRRSRFGPVATPLLARFVTRRIWKVNSLDRRLSRACPPEGSNRCSNDARDSLGEVSFGGQETHDDESIIVEVVKPAGLHENVFSLNESSRPIAGFR